MRTSFQICILSIVALFVGVAAPRVNAQCTSDLNADHSVTAQDLAIMLAFWGPTTTFAAADINQDHIVNSQDLAMLLAMWGPCAAPSWGIPIEWAPNPAVVTDANFRQRMIETGLPWRVRDSGTGIEMLLVPPGIFMMGCSPGDTECSGDESLSHQVTLTQAFYLGRTEVTQAQWLATIGSNPSYLCVAPANCSDNPVDSVTWDMIQIFCTQTGMRLPTEAEWEYACRGGTLASRYGPINNIAWWGWNQPGGNTGPITHAVATKQANTLGFYDMIGNLFEWCEDWLGPYSTDNVTNPMGSTTGQFRVLRGGAFYASVDGCRASFRYGDEPNDSANASGFRVARNP